MAFTTSSSSSSSVTPSLNVTPLIDILLVLIIIFMVITPSKPQGLKTAVPQLPETTEQTAPQPRTLVLSVAADLTVRLNRELVSRVDLPGRLRAWAAGQAEPVLFVDGDRSLEFGAVAEVMDTARGAGVERMALLPGADSGHKGF